eukprot:CAMPEP_0179210890 /NCGR_PEP_ID=MMETSP0797-20121207/24_1 /TAXON_ID=47934 /ORGANISM="Dinophysis acuminata, Strain DAEP01" /LENGTH=53 /DNA_ID=CAMNT_0020915887 /DNA_START=150 /DNA_END=309 /DNA_ORIENTATION=+
MIRARTDLTSLVPGMSILLAHVDDRGRVDVLQSDVSAPSAVQGAKRPDERWKK